MIIPGILEQNFDEVIRKVGLVDKLVQIIQIDIADGILVDGKTFSELERLDEIDTEASFDLHLMVLHPINYLKSKIQKVKSVCIHIEADGEVPIFIQKAKEMGYEVGISLNPETDLSGVIPYLHQISYVQFMTVHPGKQGREFEEGVFGKIVEFRRRYEHIKTQVDGGINEETLKHVLNVGVDNVVIGSEIFGAKDPTWALKNFIALAGGNSAGEKVQL